MAHDSNSDTSFEDFFREAFGNEPESESQHKTGTPIFADQKVPDDIMAAAQQAMFEQGSLTNDRAARQNTEKSELKSDSAAIASDNESKLGEDENDDDSAHLLKISKVRFIDNLPRKKLRSAASQPAQPVQPAPEVPVTPVSPAQANQAEKIAAQTAPSAGAKAQTDGPLNQTVPKERDEHSFRDEIMARLHAETESYTHQAAVDNSQPDSPMQAQNPSARPNSPAAHDNQQPMQGRVAGRPSSPASPTKEDFLAAAGAKPKNMPKQFSPQDLQDSETDQFSKVYIPPRQPAETRVHNYTAPIDDDDDDDDYDDYDTPSRSGRRRSSNRAEQSVQRHGRESKIHIGRSIAIILVVVVLALGGFGYFYVQNNLKAVEPKNKTVQVIDIPESTSSKGVAQILKKNNLIKNAMVFSIYTKVKGLSDFRSGYYKLNKSMTPVQIAKALEKGGSATSPSVGKITIPEGYTIEQMATAFTVNAASKSSDKTPFSQNDFLNVVKDPAFIAEMAAKYPQLFASLPAADSGVKYQLEGYLFPATYDYNASTTAKSIVEQMIAAMDTTLQPYYGQLTDLGLDVNTLLSLSALVEKEANSEDDRKNVADVFLKRLNEGWTLDTNVALLYAEGKLGTKITAAEDAALDTTMDSPYNLYQNQGTGPGPIASPSAISIAAVINHTSNPYYYFVADPNTGTIYFAETEAGQEANQEEYLGISANG
ncbi:hypothetical protein OfM1_04660 [Lactovum odontotermitis]